MFPRLARLNLWAPGTALFALKPMPREWVPPLACSNQFPARFLFARARSGLVGNVCISGSVELVLVTTLIKSSDSDHVRVFIKVEVSAKLRKSLADFERIGELEVYSILCI